jgi:hypothetical protein
MRWYLCVSPQDIIVRGCYVKTVPDWHSCATVAPVAAPANGQHVASGLVPKVCRRHEPVSPPAHPRQARRAQLPPGGRSGGYPAETRPYETGQRYRPATVRVGTVRNAPGLVTAHRSIERQRKPPPKLAGVEEEPRQGAAGNRRRYVDELATGDLPFMSGLTTQTLPLPWYGL